MDTFMTERQDTKKLTLNRFGALLNISNLAKTSTDDEVGTTTSDEGRTTLVFEETRLVLALLAC